MTTYSTTDLAFASYLYCIGKNIHSKENDGNKKIFIFVDEGDIEEIYRNYLNNKISINPKKYWDAIKTMKEFIYQQ